jgi:hypothetical protein
VLPSANANTPGPIDLDRVEIFSVTAMAGQVPPNRLLLTEQYRVGVIPVKPVPVEGEPAKEGDTRPEPGAAVFFDEELTEANLTPVKIAVPPAPPAPAAAAPAAAAPAAPVPQDPLRIYVARGVTRSGRAGPPSTRVQFPIVPLPAPPPDVVTRLTESALTVEWTPPPGATPNMGYNVYQSEDPLTPVNPQPVTGASIDYGAPEWGKRYCFRVRSLFVLPPAFIEGELSEEACITPRDTFAPAAPKRLDAVPTAGQISLIWDANAEKDLAGYIVLRGEGADAMLQPLTPEPIKETSYRDTTVKPGQLYVYAIVAVDNATPPNTSPQSPRVEETAR